MGHEELIDCHKCGYTHREGYNCAAVSASCSNDLLSAAGDACIDEELAWKKRIQETTEYLSTWEFTQLGDRPVWCYPNPDNKDITVIAYTLKNEVPVLHVSLFDGQTGLTLVTWENVHSLQEAVHFAIWHVRDYYYDKEIPND